MASPVENPKSERRKMIIAVALGVAALLTLWYAFFGSTSKPSTTPQAGVKNSNSNNALAPRSPSGTSDGTGSVVPASIRDETTPLPPSPIPNHDPVPPPVPDVSRNIFAFYVPPPKPAATPVPTPVPTPTPPPPVDVTGISPTNVFARTSDFKLDVMGDKFTPQTHIYIDGRELETRYVNQRQLSANVPAAVIAYEGARQIVVRNADGTLYSNPIALTVAAPPVPNYTYVGLVGGQQYNDTAILKDKNSKALVNVQRGGTVGNGRFRVTSISQREVVLVDTNLRIKHTLPLTTESGQTGGPQRPVVIENNDEGEP